jgi:hypothetical protein
VTGCAQDGSTRMIANVRNVLMQDKLSTFRVKSISIQEIHVVIL